MTSSQTPPRDLYGPHASPTGGAKTAAELFSGRYFGQRRRCAAPATTAPAGTGSSSAPRRPTPGDRHARQPPGPGRRREDYAADLAGGRRAGHRTVGVSRPAGHGRPRRRRRYRRGLASGDGRHLLGVRLRPEARRPRVQRRRHLARARAGADAAGPVVRPGGAGRVGHAAQVPRPARRRRDRLRPAAPPGRRR